VGLKHAYDTFGRAAETKAIKTKAIKVASLRTPTADRVASVAAPRAGGATHRIEMRMSTLAVAGPASVKLASYCDRHDRSVRADHRISETGQASAAASTLRPGRPPACRA